MSTVKVYLLSRAAIICVAEKFDNSCVKKLYIILKKFLKAWGKNSERGLRKKTKKFFQAGRI